MTTGSLLNSPSATKQRDEPAAPIAEKSKKQLVGPAVGTGRRLVLIFVDIDVELFAITLIFPVGDFVADAEEVGVAAKIKIPDEHAAEVGDVAYGVIAKAEGAEKSDRGHSRSEERR